MHSYHANCGCPACCQVEDATGKRAEAIAAAAPTLIALPSFVSEAIGYAPESWEPAICAALAAGDLAEAGLIIRQQVADHINRECERLQEARRCPAAEALAHLVYIHTPICVGVAA